MKLSPAKSVGKSPAITGLFRTYTYCVWRDGAIVECTMVIPRGIAHRSDMQLVYDEALINARKHREYAADKNYNGPFGYVLGDLTGAIVGAGFFQGSETPKDIACLICFFLEQGLRFGFDMPEEAHGKMGDGTEMRTGPGLGGW